MSALNSGLTRIQKMFDTIEQTRRHLAEIGMTRERFYQRHEVI